MMILLSCRKDETSQTQFETIQNEWHYVLFTGAEAPECIYNREDKIYTFGISTLVVEDNYTANDWCAGTLLAEGTYDYEVLEFDGVEYLFVENEEIGRIRYIDDDLFVESWVSSNGQIIDDLPTYQLEL